MTKPGWQIAYEQMGECASSLHRWADETVCRLEGQPVLDADTPEGDNARAALDNARKWRAVVEGGVN